MRLIHLALIVGAGAVLTGCATLDEGECRTVDWQTLGDSDGVRGYPQSRIGDHAKACSKHDIAVDQTAYFAGWAVGIQRFCTPQSGYNHGIDGKRYANSCPSNLAGAFESAYRPAKRAHDAEDDVRDLERSIDDLVTDLVVLNSSDDPKQRERAAAVSKQLSRERSELRRARREEDRARDALTRFLRSNPSIQP